MTDTLFEIWKTVPGFRLYEASDQGRIRNAETGYVLEPWEHTNNRGEVYHRVTLYRRDGGIRHRLVHRLILMTFRPIEHPERYHGHHKFSDTLDNRLVVLEWQTRADHALITKSLLIHEFEEAPF